MTDERYSGTENLEALEVAVRYRRFLGGLLHRLAGQGASPGRAVDFGAGIGTYSVAARQAGFAVTCVEADPDLRNRLVGDGFEVSTTTEGLDSGAFDAVFAFNVLEHIDDDEAVLRELRRIVRPGGRLLVYVPAFMCLYSGMDRLVGHVRRYRRKGLVTMATRAGWTVTGCTHADSLGFLTSLAYRAFGPRHGRLDPRAAALYDRWVFPLSRVLDRALAPVGGKNLVLWAERSDR